MIHILSNQVRFSTNRFLHDFFNAKGGPNEEGIVKAAGGKVSICMKVVIVLLYSLQCMFYQGPVYLLLVN